MLHCGCPKMFLLLQTHFQLLSCALPVKLGFFGLFSGCGTTRYTGLWDLMECILGSSEI